MVKLDMAKAYGRIEWSYLGQVMHKLGFLEQCIERVMAWVESVPFSVRVWPLFFSANCPDEDKVGFHEEVDIQTKALKEKYLGLPTALGRSIDHIVKT